MQRLTEWASTTESGDRDDLKPGVADRSWGQVSVSARECLGMARCPFGTDCFAERARAKAGAADVVVTNHALLAINAVADSAVLPEHRLLVVDEAHDLVDRVTAVATGELTATALGIASRRIARLVEPELIAALGTHVGHLHRGHPERAGRSDGPPRRRARHQPHRAARRGHRGAVDDRHLAHRPQGRRGPLRSGRQPCRNRRHRNANPGLVRAGDTRPHRRGVARSRGQPRLDANGPAGRAAVGGRPAAQPAVRRRRPRCSPRRR